MIYSCYHTAGLRARSKPEMSVGASADAGVVKGGWQTLEDPVREVGDSQPAKDRDVGEKVDDYQDQDRKVGSINPWSDGKRSGLKGLGIQLYTSSKSQVTHLYKRFRLSTILNVLAFFLARFTS